MYALHSTNIIFATINIQFVQIGSKIAFAKFNQIVQNILHIKGNVFNPHYHD